MSARCDGERREWAQEARIETGKAQLRLAQLVLTAYAEGLDIAATAERIQRSRQTAWRLRVWLGVQSGRVGRRATKAQVEAARP